MRKSSLIWICPLIVWGFVLILTNSCKKEPRTKPKIIFTEDTPVNDCDGNTYETVKIGNQIWMAENLRTTRFNNGDVIAEVTNNETWPTLTTGAYCWYNNDVTQKDMFGALYNWFAISDSRKIAPSGWHVPTDAEWTILETFLGGHNVAGGKLKSTTLWNNFNTGADNSSGFNALPGGYRNGVYGSYESIDDNGYWWSASEVAVTSMDAKYAWFRLLTCNYSAIYRTTIDKRSGFSVRCIRDSEL